MQDLCCGRPLYDYGFLGMARRWLEHLLIELRPQIQASIPIVVLEPGAQWRGSWSLAWHPAG